MIYTEMTKKAMRLMFDKHGDTLDKGGVPYVFHPFHVAEDMPDETTTIIALLHDIIEDTDVTYKQLSDMGFSDKVIDTISLLSHDPKDNYYEYIAKLAMNPLAITVKLSDLKHNSDLKRLDVITDKDINRVNKYHDCIVFLTAQLNYLLPSGGGYPPIPEAAKANLERFKSEHNM